MKVAIGLDRELPQNTALTGRNGRPGRTGPKKW